ncbi:MAG: FtsW/RodA/SpoVE family cell cycle protein [Thermomicrobiales bacterium]
MRIALGAAVIAPLVAAFVLRSLAPGADLVIVACAGMLVGIGATTLSYLAQAPGSTGAFYTAIATRHGVFASVGFLGLILGTVAARRIDWISQYPITLLVAALLLTVLTVVFGETVNGARLWLRVGPVRFQPSEVSRLLIAIFVAVYLYDRRHLVVSPWRVGLVDLPPAPYLLPLLTAVLGAVAVLFFQNDLGMAALVVLGALTVVIGVLRSRLAIGAAICLLAAAAMASYVAVDRVRGRVSGWLDPWQEPGGQGFQFIQADFVLAAGNIAGSHVGFPATNVPEVHTDFMLVGVGSQFGFLVALAMLTLLGVLISRCVLAAFNVRDELRRLLTLSLTTLIGIQVVLIVAGTLRVLPLTGLTVPLVSYGGTSMIVTLFALGLILGMGAKVSQTH